MKSNCPHCESVIQNLAIRPVISIADNGTRWETLVFACPACNKAISASFDMTAIEKRILQAIK